MEPNPLQKSTAHVTTGLSLINGGCHKSRVSTDVRLKGGKHAGNFTELGQVNSIQNCIDMCCGRPLCDIAYMENKKCFAVRCFDGVLCQTTAEKSPFNGVVQLAYMNRNGAGEKDRGLMSFLSYMTSSCFPSFRK